MKVWNGLARTRFDKVGQEGLAALSAEMIQSVRALPTAEVLVLTKYQWLPSQRKWQHAHCASNTIWNLDRFDRLW